MAHQNSAARDVKKKVGLKQKAFNWCHQYLGGTWGKISQDEFSMEVLSGGLTNELFICSLPENYSVLKGEPRKLLLRIYGRLYSELLTDVHAMVSEVVTFALLSERGVAPKLFGVFPEGRLEELLPARALMTEELKDPQISLMIAQKLREFHQLQLPLCKEPTLLWDAIMRFLEDIDAFRFDDPEDSKKHQMIKNMNLHKEYEFMRQYLEAANSSVVFCHNDLQEGNILVMHDTEEEGEVKNLRFIDFEFGGYNYRAFDIANHFCEWTYNYSLPEPPYFSMNLEHYPTRQQQLLFVRAYLGRNNLKEFCNKATLEEEELLTKVDKFVLASHFLWGLWAACQAKFCTIQFNYLDYAIARLDAYQHQKRVLGLS